MLQRQMNMKGDLTVTQLIRESAERSLNVALAPTSDNRIEAPFGSGQVLIQEVQPGLICELHDLKCHSDLEFECSVNPQISCSITLEGNLDSVDIDGLGVINNPLKQGTLIGFGEPTQWIRRVRAEQYFKTFCVTLQPKFFERFASNFEDQQLSVLESFRFGVQYEVLPLSQRLITLAHNGFSHSYSGGLALLYQESNTLQFVLEVVKLLREGNKLAQKIGRTHYDRLMHARSILDSSLLAPPKTLNLAREVGTNITTLQAHFKLALGTTIFGYVKSQRLEMARLLLTEHQLSVTETAYRVGFSSPSAFAASYRKYFGHPPSAEVAT